MTNKDITNKLLALNVNEYTEKKNGLTYLSWANAWQEILKICPDAKYSVKKDSNNIPCFGNPELGYMVYTEVEMFGVTRECYLPVLDFRNKAIKNPDMFNVNTSIMRCLTKNLAMFGLGLYIYAGEDLPEEDKKPKKVTLSDVSDRIEKAKSAGHAVEKVLEIFAKDYGKQDKEFTDQVKAFYAGL